MTFLLKVYKACNNKAFVKYIYNQQDKYNDSANIFYKVIINKLLNKCQMLIDEKERKSPSESKKHIFALIITLNKLQTKLSKKEKKAQSTNNKKKG